MIFVVRLAGREQLLDAVALLLQLLVDRVAVGDVQHLHHAGLAVRSHSQVITRSGRPNVLRKYEATLASGSCMARHSAG